MPRVTRHITTTACLLMATTALAQTGSDQDPTDGAKTADTITCADIITMDTAVVPGVLYFVAGYQEGNKAGMNGSASDSSKTASDSATNGTTTQSTADSNASDSDTTDTGTASSDSTASTSDSGTTGTTDTSQSTDSSSGSDASATAGDKMHVMRVSGLYEIPVEKIMTVCNDTPEGKVGDVVKQQGEASAETPN